jgi:hypothetical protein
VRALGRPPYRQALVVGAVATVMAALFAISYTLALGRPQPRRIPTALVGSAATHAALVARLERAAGSALELHAVPDAATAQRAIEDQHVYAALVLDGPAPRLLVASAAGASVSRVLTQAGTESGLRVVDVLPLGPEDPQGLVVFYVTLAATILGFVSMFQLRANAGELSLRAWLAAIAVLAVVAGLVLSTVVGPVLGALPGRHGETWAILSAEVGIAALVNSTMLTLVGRFAILPTWGLFVLLGNTSSGGAVAPPLLPPLYAALSRWLSPGATVEALRTSAYLPSHQHAWPLLVLAGWLAVGLAALLVAVRATGRLPTGGDYQAAS